MATDQYEVEQLEHEMGIAGHEADCWRCNTPPEDMFMAEYLHQANRPYDDDRASAVVPIVIQPNVSGFGLELGRRLRGE